MMGWLSGWAKRRQITIDHNYIDESLTDFPVLLHLSASSGINSANLTSIFDEVGSNYKKIAVTTSDGVTQCYVEVEKWNATAEEAWLWVKVPSISNTTDTTLYIYYDNTQSNNTAYIGDPGETPAQNVWDDNFKLVTHMRDDPDSSHIRDSTSYANNGTKKAAGEPVVTTSGMIDDAQDFDGEDDYVNCGNDVSLQMKEIITVEVLFKADDLTDHDALVVKTNIKQLAQGWGIEYYGGNLRFWVTHWNAEGDGGVARKTFSDTTSWHYVVGTYDKNAGSNEVNIYIDAVAGTPGSSNVDIKDADKYDVLVGQGFQNFFDGMIDEIRISDIVRSPAWVKATYETERDDLLTWGSEETSGGQTYEINVDAVVEASAAKSLQTTFNIEKDAAVTSQAVKASESTFNISKEAVVQALTTKILETVYNIPKDAVVKALTDLSFELGIPVEAIVKTSASPNLESTFIIQKDALVQALADVIIEKVAGAVIEIFKDAVVQAQADFSLKSVFNVEKDVTVEALTSLDM
ncbi:hypothetical protein DRO59_09300, partial [Candidatus Bathyarchaeota archaeon]